MTYSYHKRVVGLVARVTSFSKMNLKSGFHEISVRDEDTHKTAFCTHEGQYKYLAMPFGPPASNPPRIQYLGHYY